MLADGNQTESPAGPASPSNQQAPFPGNPKGESDHGPQCSNHAGCVLLTHPAHMHSILCFLGPRFARLDDVAARVPDCLAHLSFPVCPAYPAPSSHLEALRSERPRAELADRNPGSGSSPGPPSAPIAKAHLKAKAAVPCCAGILLGAERAGPGRVADLGTGAHPPRQSRRSPRGNHCHGVPTYACHRTPGSGVWVDPGKLRATWREKGTENTNVRMQPTSVQHVLPLRAVLCSESRPFQLAASSCSVRRDM